MLAALLLWTVAWRGGAQGPAAPQPEVRGDVILGHQSSVQLGAGVQVPLGTYLRLGVDGAAGVRVGAREGAGGSAGVGGRVDLLARFLLDPFRQSRYGLSLGGGLSVRAEPGDRVRPWLLVAIDVEGRPGRGLVPALQVGLGGGVRVGAVLRRVRGGVR